MKLGRVCRDKLANLSPGTDHGFISKIMPGANHKVPAMADILLELTGCDFDNIVSEVDYEEG